MADSSGNLKLLIGAGAGAVAATAIVLALSGRSQAPKPDVVQSKPAVPASKLPAVAPEAPPAAPAPAPVSEAGDWRGKIEVGETVQPARRLPVAPRTASDIATFLQLVAKASGGEAGLKARYNARYQVKVDAHMIELDVLGLQGVLLRDQTHRVEAVWRPNGCRERRRNAERPCSLDIAALARSAFIAHALHVVAPSTGTKMRPVKVESGLGETRSWTALAFKLSVSKERLLAFYNADTMKLNTGALVQSTKARKREALKPGQDKAMLAAEEPAGQVHFDGWRLLAGGVRFPTVWCAFDGNHALEAASVNGKPKVCLMSATVQSVTALPAGGKLALSTVDSEKIRVSVGARHRLAVAAPATGAGLLASIKLFDETVKREHHATSAGGLFILRGTAVAFAQSVTSSYPGKTVEVLARPRVAAGTRRFKIDEIAASVAAFEKEVIAAGFKPTEGPRLVFPDTSKKPDIATALSMIIEVPIAP